VVRTLYAAKFNHFRKDKKMKSARISAVLVLVFGLLVWLFETVQAEPMGTAWTYQGRLMDANGPADGLYDFEFKLFDDPSTGTQQGDTIDINDVNVIDGYFTTALDFGSDPNVFNRDARWLEIGVKPSGSSSFTILSPRQEVTPVPYALQTRGILVDNDGKVGIGTAPADSRLTVDGLVESISEGFKYPDGTIQTTAMIGGYPHHTEASYIIFKRGSDVLAQDGKDGSLLFTGGTTDATSVINEAIEETASEGGGMIFIKPGLYSLGGRLNIVKVNNITIMGTDGTILTDPCSNSAMLIDEDSNNITLHRLTFRDCNGTGINLLQGSNIRILDCVFENIQQSAIQVRVGDDPNYPVENLWITGCHIRAAGLNGTRAIHIYRTKNLFVQNNLVEDCNGTGINIQHASERVICANNILLNNGRELAAGHGIFIGSNSAYVTIRGNVITGNGGNGIEAASSSLYNIEDEEGNVIERGPRSPLYVITDNICVGNGFAGRGSGIYITGRDHVVSNNLCRDNGGDGIHVGFPNVVSRIVIQGNVIGNNNKMNLTNFMWGSGIALTDLGAVNEPPPLDDQLLLIRDNLIYKDSDSNQLRAIYCAIDSDGILIEGNRVEGHDQPQIEWDPSADHIIVRRNPGFRTEAFDSAISKPFAPDTNGVVDVNLADYLDDVNEGIVAIDPNLFRVTPRATSAGGYGGGYFNYWVEQTSDTIMGIYWDSGILRTEVGFNWMYGKP